MAGKVRELDKTNLLSSVGYRTVPAPAPAGRVQHFHKSSQHLPRFYRTFELVDRESTTLKTQCYLIRSDLLNLDNQIYTVLLHCSRFHLAVGKRFRGTRRPVFGSVLPPKSNRTCRNVTRVGHTRSNAWGESHLWARRCKVSSLSGLVEPRIPRLSRVGVSKICYSLPTDGAFPTSTSLGKAYARIKRSHN
jgi:hypothetical protein